MSRGDLINSLSADLEPVKPVAGTNLLTATWLLLGVAYVMIAALVLGPVRPGVFEQLVGNPRFLLETIYGVGVFTLVAMVAFRSAIPAALTRTLKRVAIIAVIVWVVNFLYALINPALEPSMVGKRPHCYLETLVYALPPMLFAIYRQQQLYPLKPRDSALWAGLAAGLIPAWYMQVACMYLPKHVLLFHILPGLAMAGVGVLMWLLWQRLKA
ncbi:MAG: NrsF family protein [Halioglobus sp.]